MKSTPLYATFCTQDTPYVCYAHDFFAESCQLHKLDYFIDYVPNLGNWSKNVAQKPIVIKRILEERLQVNETLVFLDSDSTIEKYPKLFEEFPLSVEFACHYLDWATWYGRPNETKKELLSGTLFVRKTPFVMQLLDAWADAASKTNVWEQKALENILGYPPPLQVKELPVEYCFIKTRPGNLPPLVSADPVILHHQASRTLKRIIGS